MIATMEQSLTRYVNYNPYLKLIIFHDGVSVFEYQYNGRTEWSVGYASQQKADDAFRLRSIKWDRAKSDGVWERVHQDTKMLFV